MNLKETMKYCLVLFIRNVSKRKTLFLFYNHYNYNYFDTDHQIKVIAFLNIMKLLDHHWYILRLTSSAFEP